MRFLVCLVLFSTNALLAAPLYSYVDQNGVKVFSNIGVGRSDRSDRQAAEPSRETDPRSRYAPLIKQWADQFDLDPHLVTAVMEVESNYDPRAISSKNCRGLMQLHPDTAKRFGVRNVFDAAENISGGVKYLSFLMDLFNGELQHVLAAYNAGENAVTRHQGIPPYPETQNYVRKVLSLYQSFTSSSSAPRSRPLQRVVLPNGSVLFTNSGLDPLLLLSVR